MVESQSLSELLQTLRENASFENELWNLTETLVSDLELCKNENTELRKQLNDVLDKENTTSHLYLELEEENMRIKNDNKALKFKLNALKLQFKSEVTEIERTCEMKLEHLEAENRKVKQSLNQKEREFFEELQLAQVTATYEFEKIEKKLKWQLSEANKQLHQSNLINSKLRDQLERMHIEKIRKSASDSMTDKTNAETTASFVRPSNNTKKSELHETINNNLIGAYEPLQVECFSTVEKEQNAERQTPTLFKGKSRPFKKIDNYKPTTPKVPPLIPCSDSAFPTNKRRKLHDPDDLSYLVDLYPQEDF